MSRLQRLSLVAAGYAIAFVVACVAVRLWLATVPPDARSSQGMLAFGESVLFLFVFTVASIPPTAAVLYFLRPYPLFWRATSLAALSVATTTAILTLADALLTLRGPVWAPLLGSVAVLTPLRTLAAPLLFLAFLLAAVVAPRRSARVLLLIAASAEAALFVSVFYIWTHPPT